MLRVTPGPVAFARTCIGLAAVVVALEGHAFLTRIDGGMPAVPLFDWFPDATELPLGAMLFVGMLAGLGLALGTGTRTCAGIIITLQGVELLADQQSYSSHRILLMMLCAHLMFAESDAAWSLRARYRGRRGSVPLWPQILMIGAISSVYLFAGLSKANPNFLSGDMLRSQMELGLPDFFYPTLGYLTVVVEVFLAVGIWFGRTRLIAVAVGVGMHVSIVVFLMDRAALTAFALLSVGLYGMILARPVGSELGLGVESHQRVADVR